MLTFLWLNFFLILIYPKSKEITAVIPCVSSLVLYRLYLMELANIRLYVAAPNVF